MGTIKWANGYLYTSQLVFVTNTYISPPLFQKTVGKTLEN